jgi:AAA domain-containing protein
MPPRAKARTRAGSNSQSNSAKRSARDNGHSKGSERAAITIEDLANFNESINILVHGDSGVGKTPFAAMAPDAVILSTEKGAISAKRYGSTAKLIRATSWLKVEAACDYLESHTGEFKWVIIDSLPKMQQLLLRYLLAMNVEEGKNNADIDLPQIQDHQKWQNMYKRFLDRLIDMDINCIFIATSMRIEIDEPDGDISEVVLPAIEGKAKEGHAIAQYTCAQMDSVYYLKVVSPKDKNQRPFWRLLTQKLPPYFAKDRYRALPRVVQYPYMPKIIELIENSISDGAPMFSPDLMTMPDEHNLPTGPIESQPDVGDFDEDDIEDLDDIEDAEEPAKPAGRRTQPKTRAVKAPARSGQTRDAGDDLDDDPADEDEEEIEEQPKPRRARPKQASRTARPVKRNRAKEPEPEDEPDEDDDFDPDLEDEELD